MKMLVIRELVSKTSSPRKEHNISFCGRECFEKSDKGGYIVFWFDPDKVEFEN